MKICISNPPYNLRWQHPPFAIMQHRFIEFGVPPENNANFVFVLSGISECDRGMFILPSSVTESNGEKEIRKNLIENNYVEAVILCPDKMFESTSIATVVLVINKNKENVYTEFIDARKIYKIEVREQRGQFSGNSHTGRVYKQENKVFDEDAVNKIADSIRYKTTEKEFCRNVGIEEIRQNGYSLAPAKYIEIKFQETKHRAYMDIVKDLNRIIKEKNCCKLTINETLAKYIGFDVALYKEKGNKSDINLNKLLERFGADELVNEDYITFTKNKNELKFENKSKEMVSSILIMIMNMWKQHIYYLNKEQNIYLAELRDALLPELMNGNIELE